MPLSYPQVIAIQKEMGQEDEQLARVFFALSDVGRIRILKLLQEKMGLCVTDVARILKITLPAASQHFRVLETVGLVRRERVGQMVCYEIKREEPLVRNIIKIMNAEL